MKKIYGRTAYVQSAGVENDMEIDGFAVAVCGEIGVELVRHRSRSFEEMQALGDQLLARPAFADYQHGTIERRGTARPLDRVEERQALTDELIDPLHCADNWCHTPSVGKIFRQKNWRISTYFWLSSRFR